MTKGHGTMTEDQGKICPRHFSPDNTEKTLLRTGKSVIFAVVNIEKND
jgi:hypothetical protein